MLEDSEPIKSGVIDTSFTHTRKKKRNEMDILRYIKIY